MATAFFLFKVVIFWLFSTIYDFFFFNFYGLASNRDSFSIFVVVHPSASRHFGTMEDKRWHENGQECKF